MPSVQFSSSLPLSPAGPRGADCTEPEYLRETLVFQFFSHQPLTVAVPANAKKVDLNVCTSIGGSWGEPDYREWREDLLPGLGGCSVSWAGLV